MLQFLPSDCALIMQAVTISRSWFWYKVARAAITKEHPQRVTSTMAVYLSPSGVQKSGGRVSEGLVGSACPEGELAGGLFPPQHPSCPHSPHRCSPPVSAPKSPVFRIFVFSCYILYGCEGRRTCALAPLSQLSGFGSLLPPCGFQRLLKSSA